VCFRFKEVVVRGIGKEKAVEANSARRAEKGKDQW
jgi:hypothetical protein